MLVLSRKHRESVVVGGGGGFQGLLKVTVLEVTGGKVKLGFEVAADIPVLRFRRASESYLIGILKVFVCKRFALLGCPLHRSAKTPVFAKFYQRVLTIL